MHHRWVLRCQCIKFPSYKLFIYHETNAVTDTITEYTSRRKLKVQNQLKPRFRRLRSTVGRTTVLGRRAFTVLRSTCSWRVTIYVGKPSAAGQPTRPTQLFILSRSINGVVRNFIGCALVAPFGEFSRGQVRCGLSTAERRLWHAVYRLTLLFIALHFMAAVVFPALRGGC